MSVPRLKLSFSCLQSRRCTSYTVTQIGSLFKFIRKRPLFPLPGANGSELASTYEGEGAVGTSLFLSLTPASVVPAPLPSSARGHDSLPATQLFHLLSLSSSPATSFSLCWALRSANGCLRFCLMFNEAFWGIRPVPVHCLWELITTVLITGVRGYALCLQASLSCVPWMELTHSCFNYRGGSSAKALQHSIDIILLSCFPRSKQSCSWMVILLSPKSIFVIW